MTSPSTIGLRYNEQPRHTPRAALLRGHEPLAWLQEMGAWGIDPTLLACYVMPESIHSIAAGGLFVILPEDTAIPPTGTQAELYGLSDGRLYLPLHATVTPALADDELQQILLWDVQVFHPRIGLVGFESADRLDLSTLLDFIPGPSTAWSLAQEGNPTRPPLVNIRIVPPTVADILQAPDRRPLHDIPPSQHEKSSESWPDKVKRKLLKAALSAIEKTLDKLEQHASRFLSEEDRQKAGRQANERLANPDHTPGLFGRFIQWMRESLEDLERKRRNEINRLVLLFDENMDEALRYAIPLDNPYAHRGTVPPTSSLNRRDAMRFDIGWIHGGSGGDVWQIDDQYYTLRQKYLDAARQATARGDFKKAAYIYAHLLHDFSSAANVLEQGGFYRDAATLYRDHVKNIPAAAGCLERGGLLLDAIELYKELGKHEKAGDLYQQAQLPEHAANQYTRSVQQALDSGDYLDAARITQHKLEQRTQAQDILLRGWTESRQAEACLQSYLGLLAQSDDDDLPRQLQTLYTETSEDKHDTFLQVLANLARKKQLRGEAYNASRRLAYTIVGQQVQQGKPGNLTLLEHFHPADRLLAADTRRYINLQQERLREEQAALWRLDPKTKWLKAVCHRNQFLILGVEGHYLQLARGNWYGYIEYHGWPDHIRQDNQVTLITEPYNSHQVLLHNTHGVAFKDLVLPRSKHFDDELIITTPAKLPADAVGYTFKPDGDVVVVKNQNDSVSLLYYTPEFALKYPREYKLSEFIMTQPANPVIHTPYRNQKFYIGIDNRLVEIFEDGEIYVHHLADTILRITLAPAYANPYIIISTPSGSMLFKEQLGAALLTADDYFAATPVDACFISSDHFVLAGRHQATVYYVPDGKPKEVYTIEPRKPIVSLLTTHKKDRFALVYQDGSTSLHTADRDE
ncbi:hypothetical protein [Dawidia soli]|uniref:MoxR-vWA-beta-propeller ternary system domain-containing protein n=1 Tax=Dawidia soli TaxID=2782352 RepID=A0AAP2D7E1_9BACT|nr:hypothetical protein [Dawidia soli]MBT1686776.1 hypothetical protein [Dawidia soli]